MIPGRLRLEPAPCPNCHLPCDQPQGPRWGLLEAPRPGPWHPLHLGSGGPGPCLLLPPPQGTYPVRAWGISVGSLTGCPGSCALGFSGCPSIFLSSVPVTATSLPSSMGTGTTGEAPTSLSPVSGFRGSGRGLPRNTWPSGGTRLAPSLLNSSVLLPAAAPLFPQVPSGCSRHGGDRLPDMPQEAPRGWVPGPLQPGLVGAPRPQLPAWGTSQMASVRGGTKGRLTVTTAQVCQCYRPSAGTSYSRTRFSDDVTSWNRDDHLSSLPS